MLHQTALANGVPRIRYVDVPRSGSGPKRVEAFLATMLKCLTDPLTEEERQSGRYVPPAQPRVMFEGTLQDAQAFYQQTKPILTTGRAPIAKYTDGLPIIIPTEELVEEMLTGTSHKPDEVIALQSARGGQDGSSRPTGTMTNGPDRTRPKGTIVQFTPMNWTATVEKVATIAVMAGCRPEYLPVVLAIAESGCTTATTTHWSQWVCVSGPISKEIGQNIGTGMLDPGNPANSTIGRTYQLMAINLGGAIPGVNRMNAIGSPFNRGGMCFAENLDGLPPGWKGLNEEMGYKKNESVAMVVCEPAVCCQGSQFAPSAYRGLQGRGYGGMAARLGVEGKVGPHNWMEYLVPGLWANRGDTPMTFLMAPRMAQDLYDYGFKSKQEVLDWIWKKSFLPVEEYRKYGWYDAKTSGGISIEPSSGKRWKDLPDNYMVPALGQKAFDNCVLVGGGPDEVCLELGGRGFFSGIYPIYSIDAWR